MLKQLLSLQKIGFLLRKWFEASPSFGYLTYTLTIRRYENTPRKFSLQTERKIFNFYYFPLSLSLSVRLIFEYCLLFSLQIKVFNTFRAEVEYLFTFVAQGRRLMGSSKNFCGQLNLHIAHTPGRRSRMPSIHLNILSCSTHWNLYVRCDGIFSSFCPFDSLTVSICRGGGETSRTNAAVVFVFFSGILPALHNLFTLAFNNTKCAEFQDLFDLLFECVCVFEFLNLTLIVLGILHNTPAVQLIVLFCVSLSS